MKKRSVRLKKTKKPSDIPHMTAAYKNLAHLARTNHFHIACLYKHTLGNKNNKSKIRRTPMVK